MLEQKAIDFVSVMMPNLDEKQRRIFLGSLSNYLGYGSLSDLQKLTGVSRTTIRSGKNEAAAVEPDPRARPSSSELRQIRAPGAGRRPVTVKQPQLLEALLRLFDGNPLEHPESPLCWTTKSSRLLHTELTQKGFTISHTKILGLLEDLGFSFQQKTKYDPSGKDNSDRDEQFNVINSSILTFQNAGQPVIYIDAKRKELIENYKNSEQKYREIENSINVYDQDFPGEEEQSASYGIYDLSTKQGFVNLGICTDTAEFAVNSIRYWWRDMGTEAYPNATDLLITAYIEDSSVSRDSLWKKCLQDFSNETAMTIHVSHFPHATCKWNTIKHRFFSCISKNWRERPLTTLGVVISLISSTTPQNGSREQCGLEKQKDRNSLHETDHRLSARHIERDTCHGEWNYCIRPQI